MEDIKYKRITSLAGRLLSEMNVKGVNWFTLDDAYTVLSEMKPDAVRRLVARMAADGLLMRVRDGVYYIIPFEQDSDLFLPDWHLLAEPLVGNDYYIGYYSALQIHNLITQPSLKEQIVVPRQLKPAMIELKEVPFQYIYHNPKHYFGGKKIWIDDFHRVWCSDLEKTMIDCLYKPDYAGGIVEVAKAIYMSKDKLRHEQLLAYAIRFDSQVVIKRLGYLLELLSISTPIIDRLQKVRSKTISPLDTEVPKQGKILSRWSIQQNVETETIIKAIAT